MKVDENALRDLARNAIPGDWYIDEHTTIDKFFAIYDSPDRGTEVCQFDYDDVDHEWVDLTADFIRAANPLTVIKLLNTIDELRAARNRLADIAEHDLSSFACDTREVVELRKAGE